MILSTAYLPPVIYFRKLASVDSAVIERHENFVKQSYRNRCYIYGANGIQSLIIPLVHTHDKTVISEKRIAYHQNWQQQHWKSIESAYRNTPYFIYYADELKPFYQRKYDFLLEHNSELLKVLLRLLKIQTQIVFTTEFVKDIADDFRYTISPKEELTEIFLPYIQMFDEKHGFQPNLSIIDLLFNIGPNAIDYLRNS